MMCSVLLNILKFCESISGPIKLLYADLFSFCLVFKKKDIFCKVKAVWPLAAW